MLALALALAPVAERDQIEQAHHQPAPRRLKAASLLGPGVPAAPATAAAAAAAAAVRS